LRTEERASRRWLRLAPRYLGRLAQGVRVLYCEPDAAQEFVSRVQLGVKRGEIGVQVRMSWCNANGTFLAQPSPPAAQESAG